MANAVISLMQVLYFDEGSARAILIRIGYPPERIPLFRAADTFWPDVVIRLKNGAVQDGMRKLLAAAVADNPDNETARSLLARVGGAGADRADPEQTERAGGPLAGTGRGPAPVKVLCLFADPVPESKIRLDEEKRLLSEIAEHGGVEIAMRHAVRETDIIGAILAEKPRILHFAGHGTKHGRLVFGSESGSMAPVSAAALAAAIAATMPEPLDCVVLNSCFTGQDAEAFRGTTQCVAGSVRELADDCALAFTRGFYTGLRAGQTAQQAFLTGLAQMKLLWCDTSGIHFVSFRADG